MGICTAIAVQWFIAFVGFKLIVLISVTEVWHVCTKFFPHTACSKTMRVPYWSRKRSGASAVAKKSRVALSAISQRTISVINQKKVIDVCMLGNCCSCQNHGKMLIMSNLGHSLTVHSRNSHLFAKPNRVLHSLCKRWITSELKYLLWSVVCNVPVLP